METIWDFQGFKSSKKSSFRSAHTKEWADGGDVWILKFTFLDILPIKYVAEMPKAMNIAGRELNIPRIDGQEHSAI